MEHLSNAHANFLAYYVATNNPADSCADNSDPNKRALDVCSNSSSDKRADTISDERANDGAHGAVGYHRI